MQPTNAEQIQNPFPDIVSTSGQVNGAPRLAGRLLSVRDIVSSVYCCNHLKAVADELCISISQIRSALRYCSASHCKEQQPKSFCDTCSLKREQKGPLDIFRFEEVTCNNTTYVRGEDSLFLGTMDELLDDWNGKDWWEIATDLLIDHRQDFSGDTLGSFHNHTG